MKKLFDGVGIAIATPFKYNKVDYASLKKLINKGIKEGASAIIVLGTTGEGSTISAKERAEILHFCRQIIPPKVKMIVGTGNNNFTLAMQNTITAKQAGADGVLVVTPYYNKTTQRGLVEYYKRLATLQIPIIMYNVPARTGLNIDLATVEQIIKENPYVYGIKEATCDINRIMQLCQICQDKIAVYSGEDDLNFLFYCLGADGTISVTANSFTKQTVDVYKLVKQEKLKEAFSLHQKLSPINKMMFCETNPIPVKYFLKQMDIIALDEVRMPLVELSPQNKEKIDEMLEEIKID
ncbi:MAG: 4-hydroxy-tetrahydrodipicolinate synthase [Clostridia bacterium]|nr:4-hydroxy-tetrahydrodipicolinate synthase [Clostridia bacterium]